MIMKQKHKQMNTDTYQMKSKKKLKIVTIDHTRGIFSIFQDVYNNDFLGTKKDKKLTMSSNRYQ